MVDFTPTFPEDFSEKGVRLMILGEAPGAKEEQEGLPFVGASGKLLLKTLEEYGFTRKNLYISNVFWQRPPNNNVSYFFCKKTSDEEKAEQFGLYKNQWLKREWEDQIYRLQEELELIQPEIVMTVGSIPLWALRGEDNISEVRGEPKLIIGPVKYKYSVMFPTFHPAYILRNRKMMDEFKKDVSDVKDLLDTPPWDWPPMFGKEWDRNFKNE